MKQVTPVLSRWIDPAELRNTVVLCGCKTADHLRVTDAQLLLYKVIGLLHMLQLYVLQVQGRRQTTPDIVITRSACCDLPRLSVNYHPGSARSALLQARSIYAKFHDLQTLLR